MFQMEDRLALRLSLDAPQPAIMNRQATTVIPPPVASAKIIMTTPVVSQPHRMLPPTHAVRQVAAATFVNKVFRHRQARMVSALMNLTKVVVAAMSALHQILNVHM